MWELQYMPMPSRSLRIIYVCGTDRALDARECFLCSPLICFDRSAALPGWKGLTGRGWGVAGTLYITQVWEKSFVFHAELRRDMYRYCEEKKRRERICENLSWMTDWQKHKGTRSSAIWELNKELARRCEFIRWYIDVGKEIKFGRTLARGLFLTNLGIEDERHKSDYCQACLIFSWL